VADEVLAKHDEKYMPPEVARSLQRNAAAGVPTPPGKTAAAAATASGDAR
jgi:cytochrome c-type biogenesis protein CcmE